jgi:hypothetical protein
MANVLYENWIDFAEMTRNEVHQWFFDPIGWDPSNYVIQATATPLSIHQNETQDDFIENQVEVTRLFLLRKGSGSTAPNECQINIWVTNTGSNVARYRLNVTLVPPE